MDAAISDVTGQFLPTARGKIEHEGSDESEDSGGITWYGG